MKRLALAVFLLSAVAVACTFSCKTTIDSKPSVEPIDPKTSSTATSAAAHPHP